MAKPPSLCNRYTLRLYIRDDVEAEIADYLAPLDRFFRQERLRELLRLGWLAEQQGLAQASMARAERATFTPAPAPAPKAPSAPAPEPVAPSEPESLPPPAPADTAPVVIPEALTALVDGPAIADEPAFTPPLEDGDSFDSLDPLAIMRRRSSQ